MDYAIIEKADNVVMVESGFDWDDVGEWPAVERHYPADDAGNVVRGEAHLEAASSNIVFRGSGSSRCFTGVEDLIVVRTEDATLICHKDKAQSIKGLVKDIRIEEFLEPIDVKLTFLLERLLFKHVIDECAIWV